MILDYPNNIESTSLSIELKPLNDIKVTLVVLAHEVVIVGGELEAKDMEMSSKDDMVSKKIYQINFWKLLLYDWIDSYLLANKIRRRHEAKQHDAHLSFLSLS